MDLSIEKDGEFMDLGDSGKYESRVNAATEELETDIGNKPQFKVYIPKEDGSSDRNPVLSFNEVFQHVNIDTNKVNHIVNKNTKHNNQINIGNKESRNDRYTFEQYKNNETTFGYLGAYGDKTGAFENLQPPTLEESSYNPITQRIRATISPGLFGAKNEISASYQNRFGNTENIILVKHGDGHIYESKEDVSLNKFGRSNEVTFAIQDSQNKLPANKISTVVKYNTVLGLTIPFRENRTIFPKWYGEA